MGKLSRSEARIKRHHRVRLTVTGTPARPRLAVYRSLTEIYVQLIDDLSGKTLLSASSLAEEIASQKMVKIEQAKKVGKIIAQKAIEAGISKVVFDRNGYLYHGRVKSLAEAAREGGLKF